MSAIPMLILSDWCYIFRKSYAPSTRRMNASWTVPLGGNTPTECAACAACADSCTDFTNTLAAHALSESQMKPSDDAGSCAHSFSIGWTSLSTRSEWGIIRYCFSRIRIRRRVCFRPRGSIFSNYVSGLRGRKSLLYRVRVIPCCGRQHRKPSSKNKKPFTVFTRLNRTQFNVERFPVFFIRSMASYYSRGTQFPNCFWLVLGTRHEVNKNFEQWQFLSEFNCSYFKCHHYFFILKKTQRRKVEIIPKIERIA